MVSHRIFTICFVSQKISSSHDVLYFENKKMATLLCVSVGVVMDGFQVQLVGGSADSVVRWLDGAVTWRIKGVFASCGRFG